MKLNLQAVVIGVSAGGFQALHTLLPLFPKTFLPPIIIVQHRMADSDDFFVDSLNKCCQLLVKEPDDKEKIRSGTVYIAPAGYHLFIEKNRTFSLSLDEPVRYSRPSIDVLFEAGAAVYKTNLAGVILTGANADGSNGIKTIKDHGGLTVAQDPETAEIATMPRSAIKTDAVDFILSLEDIPQFLSGLME
ncbi:MAG: chemotaxis protein CheB [Desulfobacteraceae bacterium 4572_19]|nr:MAG: chemotaxis protein CheB [Desulfobacteraceae bacterium 4572_19]